MYPSPWRTTALSLPAPLLSKARLPSTLRIGSTSPRTFRSYLSDGSTLPLAGSPLKTRIAQALYFRVALLVFVVNDLFRRTSRLFDLALAAHCARRDRRQTNWFRHILLSKCHSFARPAHLLQAFTCRRMFALSSRRSETRRGSCREKCGTRRTNGNQAVHSSVNLAQRAIALTACNGPFSLEPVLSLLNCRDPFDLFTVGTMHCQGNPPVNLNHVIFFQCVIGSPIS